MKKITIYTLIALLGVLTSFKPKDKKEAELKWYDWNEGYSIAAKKKKLILVDVFTSWCGWCKKMDKDTYEDADVKGRLNKDFVAVKLNPEKAGVTYKLDTMSVTGRQLLDILTNYNNNGYPTTIIVDPKKNEVLQIYAGYQDPAQFKKSIETVLAAKAEKKKGN